MAKSPYFKFQSRGDDAFDFASRLGAPTAVRGEARYSHMTGRDRWVAHVYFDGEHLLLEAEGRDGIKHRLDAAMRDGELMLFRLKTRLTRAAQAAERTSAPQRFSGGAKPLRLAARLLCYVNTYARRA